jgi:putative transcriptional regulator
MQLEQLLVAIYLIKSTWAMENKLKELRLQGKVSQSALADALSVSRQTINSIENGKFDPSLTLAMKLTRFFKVSLDEIFIYKD